MLEKLVQEQEVPGFAIAVVEGSRVAYAAGFGVRNVTGKDDPITTRSLFHMASITKTFVATSIMQLVENGKIDLDAPVVKYLPHFRMDDERFKVITVRQMATHTSGMPDVNDYEWSRPQYDEGALDRYVRSLGNLKLDFAPGKRFEYSSMAFEILGAVVANVSGETFDDYVQRHILAPLGMKDSTLLVKQAGRKFYDFGVAQLNGVGGYLLGIGHVKDAIRLFEMNVAAYPTSAHTFDALGKAYEKDGNPEGALRSYEKALELNPKQAHATEGLKRLRK